MQAVFGHFLVCTFPRCVFTAIIAPVLYYLLVVGAKLRLIHTHSIPCPCRAHAMPLPCRAAKGLECVFPIDLHNVAVSDSHLPCPCHALTMQFSQGHGTARPSRDGRALSGTAWQGTAWARHAMCESAFKYTHNLHNRTSTHHYIDSTF